MAPGAAGWQEQSTVGIGATAGNVWAVLTDFARYAEWNPFMTRIDGVARKGAELVVRMSPAEGRAMTFKPTVLVADPGTELRWLGKLAFGGLFDGEHSFVLTPQPGGGTRLVHSETFSGVLVPLLKGTLKGTDQGFVAFNGARKERAEHLQPGSHTSS